MERKPETSPSPAAAIGSGTWQHRRRRCSQRYEARCSRSPEAVSCEATWLAPTARVWVQLLLHLGCEDRSVLRCCSASRQCSRDDVRPLVRSVRSSSFTSTDSLESRLGSRSSVVCRLSSGGARHARRDDGSHHSPTGGAVWSRLLVHAARQDLAGFGPLLH